MNEINTSFLNPVKNRFLPLPRSATEELEHELNISDFKIIKEIGTGAYAKVYLAIHKQTKVKYAIKAIDKLNIENKQEKACFNREVEIMYKLDHPNIAKLYSHFEDSKFCYLVMQYIPNGSAYDLLVKSGKKTNFELVASVIRDVIRAIYYLHNMVPKIIHRDIKPENILLDENNNAYLIDFGWSNYLINSRRRNTICGTPLYRPPEMVFESDYDERIDIWSIGVLLFELSTGKIPFQGNDIETVKENISQLNISWPNNIDSDIKDLCSKILKINPNHRPEIENILEHKFFKKYLGIGDVNKNLITPKKSLNKIFLVSKEVPQKHFSELNKPLKENVNSRYNKTERRDKKLDEFKSGNKEKSNTDTKAYIGKRSVKNVIHEINYVNKDNIDIKKKLINKINRDDNKGISSKCLYKINKINNYYHPSINLSSKRNMSHTNSLVNNNNNRSNHIKVLSSSFVGNNNVEEIKSSKNLQNYSIYACKKYKSSKMNNIPIFLNKKDYNTHENKNRYENLNKKIKDKNEKIIYPKNDKIEKKGHFYTYTNINEEDEKDLSKKYDNIQKENNNLKNRLQKYNTYIINDTSKSKKVNETEKVEPKQQINLIVNRGDETYSMKKKTIYG